MIFKQRARDAPTCQPPKGAFCNFASWTLNEETCVWDPPVVRPDDGQRYYWNEETQQWDLNE